MTAKQKTPAPYGSWDSPISAEMIAGSSIRFGGIALDASAAYWIESRPSEQGRNVIMCREHNGDLKEMLPAPFSATSKAHEYGGGAFIVANGLIFFVNQLDQNIYRVSAAGPRQITDSSGLRFADMAYDRIRKQIITVVEAHQEGSHQPDNYIGSVDATRRQKVRKLISGNDFYSNPRLSPDGSQLSWLTWNHPNMPWDESELWLADISPDGVLSNERRIAGGEGTSVFQPQWSPAGVLCYVSDISGWWNLYDFNAGTHFPLLPMEAEFALPQWVFGMSTYGFLSEDSIAAAFTTRGEWRIARINLETRRWEEIQPSFSEITHLTAGFGNIVIEAAAPSESSAIVHLDLSTGKETVLKRSSEQRLPAGLVSIAESIEYATAEGEVSHALYYPPQNPSYCPVDNELPPLIVTCHGGPTAASYSGLNLKLQYWTSRGFAVLDVNYRGSTGFGRAYRKSLDGKWGIADVADCIAAAEYLVSRGLADPERLIIRGGSAGGFTVLATLVQSDLFSAGASHYGICDLELLAKDTHKFEARYLDGLIGAWPEQQGLYRERSPIHNVERLSSPVIFFQGMEDKVVPAQQTRKMAAALDEQKIPVSALFFEGEGHGFRQMETVITALEAELYFYARIFNLPLAAGAAPIRIKNLHE